MRCPVCTPSETLEIAPLENGELKARACPRCRGTWIRSADFWRWRALHPENLPEVPPAEGAAPSSAETTGLRRCPDCEYVLARVRVGHGIPFTVDRCRNCEGAWLDGGEWEALKARQLHDDLPLIFDDAWQKAVKREEQVRFTEDSFRRRLGDEAYRKARDFRAWLEPHPNRSEIFAYLRLPEPDE